MTKIKLSRALMTAGMGLALIAGAANAADKPIKEIHIVTEGGFPPWNYTKPDGSIAGFEIDLVKNLCDRMKVSCTFTAQSFDGMIPALNAGKFDAIVDDLGITPKREESIAFSVPYASLCYTLATRKGSDIAAKLPSEDKVISLDNEAAAAQAWAPVKAALQGKVVGTMSAGTSVNFTKTYLQDTAQVRQYKTPDARDLDLTSGRVDAIVASKDSLLGSQAKPGGSDIVLAGPCFSGGVVGKGAGIGLRKGDTALKALFDKAIQEALADGTVAKLSQPVFHMDVSPR